MPIEHCIVCTTEAGGVAVVYPSDEAVFALMFGQGVDTSVRGRAGLIWYLASKSIVGAAVAIVTDEMDRGTAMAWEVHKMVSCPHWRTDRQDRMEFAAKWVSHVVNGGLSYMEAVTLIGEKDRPLNSVAPAVVTRSEVPSDRRNRDSWRRSANGGPIWADGVLGVA